MGTEANGSWACIGGEHKLFEHLKDDTGVVREARLQALLDENDGMTAAEAFAWLDSNGDGAVSEEQLDQKVVHELFTQQFVNVAARSGQAALKSIAQRIPRAKRGKPVVHCLAEMGDEEICEYAAEALSALLASLKDQREEIRTAQKTKANGGSDKFSFQGADEEGETFRFGPLKMFKQGLANLIGLPATNVKDAMEREHQSTECFTTGNYNVTTYPRQEYNLVAKNANVDYEFDQSRVRRDVDVLMQDFMGDDVLKTLTREELIALILYTGPLFDRYNGVLRRVLFPMAERLQAGAEIEVDATQVEYVTTIHMLVSGVLKLSEGTSLVESRTVYRGLQGRKLPESKADKNGCRGGTELGFMSTTTNIEVAKQYADVESGQWPTVFAISVGQVDRGGCLQRLSQYPGEAEALLPPLSNLEVTGDPEVRWEGTSGYWLVPLRLNVNLKSSLREEHEQRRKREALGTASSVVLDTKAALQAQMLAPDKTNPNDGTELYQSLLAEANALVSTMRERDAGWFNDDFNFEAAVEELVNVRSYSRETMDAFIHNTRTASYFTQYSMTMWHRLKEGDARAAYAQAKESGDAAERAAAATKLAVLEGYLIEGEPDSKTGLDGETALMRGAAAGDEERLELLADAKCDLNAASAKHCTALLAAVVAGQDGAVKKLVELGADPEQGKVDTAETALHQAAEHVRVHCLKALIEGGALVNAAENIFGNQPLHLSAFKGDLECVKALKEAGADIHGANNYGDQPLHLAAQKGHLECAKWLKEAGANIHAVDKKGMRPIHYAEMGGQVECTKWLKEG